MKMVMIICPENRNEELRELIAKHDIHAYTELKEITGEALQARNSEAESGLRNRSLYLRSYLMKRRMSC